MKKFLLSLMALTLLEACGVATPERALSDLERMELSTRTLGSERTNTFNACVNVLQNSGYMIQSADLTTGIISAVGESSVTENVWADETVTFQVQSTVFVEGMKDGTRVRVTFMQKQGVSKSLGQSAALDYFIEDAVVYRNFFNELDKILFVRDSGL